MLIQITRTLFGRKEKTETNLATEPPKGDWTVNVVPSCRNCANSWIDDFWAEHARTDEEYDNYLLCSVANQYGKDRDSPNILKCKRERELTTCPYNAKLKCCGPEGEFFVRKPITDESKYDFQNNPPELMAWAE